MLQTRACDFDLPGPWRSVCWLLLLLLLLLLHVHTTSPAPAFAFQLCVLVHVHWCRHLGVQQVLLTLPCDTFIHVACPTKGPSPDVWTPYLFVAVPWHAL